jgi:serine/threonine protein kinase
LDLLDKLLDWSPLKRITVEEALDHEYLKELHDPLDEVSSFKFFKIISSHFVRKKWILVLKQKLRNKKMSKVFFKEFKHF